MLASAIKTKITQTGETIHDFAARADVDCTIFYRKRAITERIAWKLARAYARLSGLTDEQAYTRLIIEDAEPQRTFTEGRRVMPQISTFYGISIWMYYRDHVPPHFHAKYGEDEALII